MPGDALCRWFGWCCAALGITSLGCAGSTVRNEPRPSLNSCVIAHATGGPAESLTVALPAHAATGWEADPTTRFIDGLRFEPLFRVDCNGVMIPALAESWQAGSTGRTWTFTIREGAQLSDGTPVTVRDIVASWRTNAPASHGEFGRFVADSARLLDARTIVVTLPDTSVRLLSDPALSLRVTAGAGVERLGTGAYVLLADSGGLLLHPGAAFANAPRIRLARSSRAMDPRDMLDAGVDLLVTEDPSVMRYATAHPELDALPLPPRRVYVLVTTADSSGIDEGSLPASWLREELARDVVPARALAAKAWYWWNELPVCAPAASQRASEPVRPASRIVHDVRDPVAGALAQRLIALATGATTRDAEVLKSGKRETGKGKRAVLEALTQDLGSAGITPVAVGLPSEQFLESLKAGNEVAYVVSLPVTPLDPCLAIGVLGDALEGATAAERLTPLIEAGGWAVVRRGRVTLELDRDGSIHFGSGKGNEPGRSR